MTVYSTDPAQLMATIRDTLADRVAPGVTDDTARGELAAVIEQFDNLMGRLAWDPVPLARTGARTEELARQLGLPPTPGDDTVETLRARRRQIGAALGEVYRGGEPDEHTIAAVLRFTETDVDDQVTTALRRGLQQ